VSAPLTPTNPLIFNSFSIEKLREETAIGLGRLHDRAFMYSRW
jgi:hypothetical protein